MAPAAGNGAGSPGRGEVFSHSRLSNFETCPKKFHFRYVLRIPSEIESIEGFVGKRVHEVLERLYLAAGEGRVPSLRAVLRRYQLLWEEQYHPDRVRIAREDTPAHFYREDGERCLSNYYRRHYPFDADETLALEERVSFSLDEAGDYRMRGVVDRVVRASDSALEIHDYKTSRRIPPQSALDRDRQLALYQIGIAERYGDEQPFRLVWHYLLLDQTRSSQRTPEQLDELRLQTVGLIDRIRSEREYPARPGPLCRWCEFADRCPAAGGRARPVATDAAPGAPPTETEQLALF